jgi:hypothetical protein
MGSLLFVAAIALGVALAIAPTSVLAKVVVRGNPKAVSIEAQNASVEEILVARVTRTEGTVSSA